MKTLTPHTSTERTARAGTTTPCRQVGPAGASALRASPPDGHPVATFLDEHQAILARLERLSELTASAAVPGRAGLEELALLALRGFGVEPHHRREEEVLFPALQRRGFHGPPELMLSEHVRLRALTHALDDLARRLLAGDRGAWRDARATAEALVERLRAHIAEEDGVLHPMALRAIREPSVWADLRRRCDAIGYGCTGTAASPGHERP